MALALDRGTEAAHKSILTVLGETEACMVKNHRLDLCLVEVLWTSFGFALEIMRVVVESTVYCLNCGRKQTSQRGNAVNAFGGTFYAIIKEHARKTQLPNLT